MGFKLEELEVDIVGKMSSPMWGRCVWYADHPKYAEPIPAFFTGMNFKPIFYHAMFRTEHAGDQHYGLYSTQLAMGGWTLLHKTLLYRKVRFSAPSESEARAAA